MTLKRESKWVTVQEHTYESFPIFSLKKSTRLNPRNQQSVEFIRLDGLDWVNIIAITENNEVVLVEQFRHGSEEWTIEIPGGCVDPGEAPENSAIRELEEETGYSTSSVEFLGKIRPNPALLSNYCTIYLARNVFKVGQQNLDSGEDIHVLLKPLQEVVDLIKTGKINHALVIAAFGLMQLLNKK